MKKEYKLISKEKIDGNLRICNNLKLIVIFLTTALLTWIIIDFVQGLREINDLINDNNFDEINNMLIELKEAIISNFIKQVLIILIPSVSIIILTNLIESNIIFIDTIDDTNEQIIDDMQNKDTKPTEDIK